MMGLKLSTGSVELARESKRNLAVIHTALEVLSKDGAKDAVPNGLESHGFW